jgi:RNA polymerase sigma factor (sigma-70 family)
MAHRRGPVLAISPADFESVYVQHHARLVRLAQGFGLDYHRAEDTVQNAVTDCYRARAGNLDASNAVGYFTTAVMHAASAERSRAADRPRRELRSVQGGYAGAQSNPQFESQIEDRELIRAVGRLPQRQAEVLVLRFVFDLTEDQTAVALGLGVNTVKSHSRRGLDKLRKWLGGEAG